MSTLMVSLALSDVGQRDRPTPLDVRVDTDATYVLMPSAVVARLAIPAIDEWPANPADGDRLVYRLGEVRIRFEGRELSTIFVAAPPHDGSRVRAFTFETASYAAAETQA